MAEELIATVPFQPTLPPNVTFGGAPVAPTPTESFFDVQTGQTFDVPAGLHERERSYLIGTQGSTPSRETIGAFDFGEIFKSTGKGVAARGVDFALNVPQILALETEERFQQSIAERPRFSPGDILSATMPFISIGEKRAAVERIKNVFTGGIREDRIRSQRAVAAIRRRVDSNREWIRQIGLVRPEGKFNQVAFDVGGGFASIGLAVGMTAITRNPVYGSVVFGMIQNSSIYEEAREKGFGPDDAGQIATLAGMTEGAVEAFGLGLFFRLVGVDKVFKRIVARTLTESGQEALQATGEEVITQAAGVREVDFSAGAGRVAYAAMIGAIAGAPVATITSFAEGVATEEGITPEQAAEITERVMGAQDELQDETATVVEDFGSQVSADVQGRTETAGVIDQFGSGEEIDVRANIEGINPESREVLQTLIANLGQDISPEQAKAQERKAQGRVRLLEERIEQIDTQIDLLEGQIEERQARGAPVARLESRIETLDRQRAKMEADVRELTPSAAQLQAERTVEEQLAIQRGTFLDERINTSKPLPANIQSAIEDALRILPENVQIAVADNIRVTASDGLTYELNGFFDPQRSLLKFAADSQNPAGVVRHEAIHALRQNSIISPDQWQTLVSESRSQRWRERFNIDGTYRSALEEDFDSATIEERLDEEAVAEAFSRYNEGRRFTSRVNGIFEFLKRAADSIRRAVTGDPNASALDIFRAIEGGQLEGQRGPQRAVRDLLQERIDRLARGDVKVTGRTLDAQARAADRAAMREFRRGFNQGARAARQDIGQAQNIITDLITKSNLDQADKAKFIRAIKNIKNLDQLQKRLPAIQSRVIKLIDKSAKRSAAKRIRRRLKQFKRPPAGKQGKLSPETQDILDNMRAASRLKKEDAARRMDEIIGDGITVPAPEQSLELSVLSMRAAPDSLTRSDMEALEDELEAILDEGKAQAAFRMQGRSTKKERLKSDFIELIGPVEAVGKNEYRKRFKRAIVDMPAQGFNAWSGVFRTRLEALFRSTDAKAVKKFLDSDAAFFDETLKFERGKQQMLKKISDRLQELTGLSQRKLVTKLIQDESGEVKLTPNNKFTFADGKQRRLRLSRAQLRARWMQLRNPELRQSMMDEERGEMYTPEIETAINDAMTEEDVQIAEALLDFYDGYYDRINDTFKRLYGFNLPRVEVAYSPIRRERADGEADPFLRAVMYQGSGLPGSLQARVPNVRRIKNRGDFSTLVSHINEMEYFIAYAEKASTLNSALKSQEVQELLQDAAGDGLVRDINMDLDYFVNRGILNSELQDATFNTLIRNFGFAQLANKWSIGLKQLTSFPAFMTDVKAHNFWLSFLDPKGFKEATDAVRESEFWKLRGIPDRDLQAIVENRHFLNLLGSRPHVQRFMMMPILLGDKGAILVGGAAHYHAKRKEGATHEEALRSFGLAASRTQQDPSIDQVSRLQRSENPLSRIMSQFMSAPNALARAEYSALINFARGRTNKRELAKGLFIYHFLIPNLFMLAVNAGHWDREDQLRATILGSLAGGIFFYGTVMEAMVTSMLGDDPFTSEIRHPLDFINDAIKSTRALRNEDITFEEFWEISRSIDLALQAVGGLFGIAASTIYRRMVGVKKVLSGEEGGIPLAIGYSPYIVEEKFDSGF